MKICDIKRIGVAGSGLMGSGIAQIFAQSGYDVVLYGRREESLEKAKKQIELNQENLMREGLITEKAAREAVKNIVFTTSKDELLNVDVFIESITENLEIKQVFLKEISESIKKGAVLATNTSGLSITAIARDIKQKERFAGMHWWNPPHIIPLVEIIKGEETSDDTASFLSALAEKVGKKTVTVQKDAPGFIGNRLQFAMLREALNIVEQGIASPEDVDRALKYGPGFRYGILGPLQTADLGGLDTFYSIASYLFKDLGSMREPPNIMKDLIENNHFGLKSGSGFYDYSDGRDKKVLRERDSKFLKMLKYIYSERGNLYGEMD